MCGFAGIIDFNGLPGDPESRRRVLRAMGAQLALRGPDDEQFYDDGILSFVFRRLAIVDIEDGRQPIWNEDRTVFAAVNGEIYNHAEFRPALEKTHRLGSKSDCEVIVHLYEDQGPAMLERLNGMFAMAVWDTRERTLFLARDRLGIKPLFYARIGSTLLFASELKAMLAHPLCPRELNWRELAPEVDDWAQPPTYIKGIHHLPGGHYLSLRAGSGAQPRAWWRLTDHFPASDEVPENDVSDLVERYGELLRDAVHKRLMSDVPVGLFLSGGIDSTLLAALVAERQPGLHCFTVVEDTTVAVGDVREAKRAAELLGHRYHPVRYDHATMGNELGIDITYMEKLIWAVESPRLSFEWLFKLELHRYAKTVSPGMKVMLLGQGADEFTGGYSNGINSTHEDWASYQRWLLNGEVRLQLLEEGVPEHFWPLLSPPRFSRASSPGVGVYHRHMQYRLNTLQRYNLWHEDRTASAQGIESRVPFLDHRLVELLAGIPARLHAELFYDKRIVREQLRRALPSYPPDKQKVPFYRTGNEVSQWKFQARLLHRLFPEFRRRYLAEPGSIFSERAYLRRVEEALRRDKLRPRKIENLLKHMAVAMFERMIRELPDRGPPAAIKPPSPLREQHIERIPS